MSYRDLVRAHLALVERHRAEAEASTQALDAEKKRILDALAAGKAAVMRVAPVTRRDALNETEVVEADSSATTFEFEGCTYVLLDFHGRKKLRFIEPPSDYPKLEPKHGAAYARVEALKEVGEPVCDAVDHNAQDEYGCSNPQCWKHAKPRPRR